MATLISAATGNWTSSGTWKKVAPAGLLESTGAATALTTGNLDSATFVLAANQVDGVAVKVASRASGSPSNTITITLRNSTTATNIQSVTINVSDIDACNTTDLQGGWYFFKFAANHTPNGTDSYVIRATLSSTSTAVSLYTNGTANNWARMVRETTTQAPGAGDNAIVVAEFTGAGTSNTFTVTMDETATTDYGAASTNVNQSAVDACKGGTLKFGTSASTNYVLRLSGNLQVYSGGTFSIGDDSTQMPRTSSGTLEFDCGADGDFGLYARSGSTCNLRGLSRTSGKDIWQTKLTADAAASATSLTVADDTGWLNGDEIAIAPTARTSNQSETRTLNANAGASSLSIGSGLTNAHGGDATNKVQAEVVLLTRNVRVRSTSSTFMTFVYTGPTSAIDFRWVDFQYGGASSTKRCLTIDNTNAFTLDSIVVRDTDADGIGIINVASTGWTANNIALYNSNATVNRFALNVAATTGSGWTLSNVTCIGGGAGGGTAIQLDDLNGTISNIAISGRTNSNSLQLGDNLLRGWVIDGINIHTNQNNAILFAQGVREGTIKNGYVWRNINPAVQTGGGTTANISWENVRFFGNATANVQFILSGTSTHIHNKWSWKDCHFSGDSTFATAIGLDFSGGATISAHGWRFEGCTFGVASGIYTAHTGGTSGDISLPSISGILPHSITMTLVNCTLASSNEILNTGDTAWVQGGFVAFQHLDATAGNNKVYTPNGVLSYETTTFDISPSLKMTPSSTLYKLESNAGTRGKGVLKKITSGNTLTATVKVQKDGSYNGNAPRLIVKSNPAIGITSDTVIDTLSVGSDTWETLSGVTASATADGVLEFVVDCDGTAGNVFVDTWIIS